MKKQNPFLIGIYKASQCTDIADCENALQQIEDVKKHLVNVRAESRAVYIREISLRKKLKLLFQRSVQ
jgi:hypothetical protein